MDYNGDYNTHYNNDYQSDYNEWLQWVITMSDNNEWLQWVIRAIITIVITKVISMSDYNE